MFREKNDFQFDLSGSSEIGGLSGFSGAWAFTDNFGINLGFDYNYKLDSFPVQISSWETGYANRDVIHKDYDYSFIYFKPINDYHQYEIQLGFSYVQKTVKYKSDPDPLLDFSEWGSSSNHAYSRFYIQPAIGRNGKYFDWNFATRIQLINYHDLSYEFPLENYQNYSDILIEPGLTIRAGYRYIKLMAQVGLRANTRNGIYGYHDIHGGFGLIFSFNSFSKFSWRDK